MTRRVHLGLWFACTLTLFGQNTSTPPVPDTEAQPPARVQTDGKPQFFSGTITELEPDHVTVSRALVGKAPESRTFLINPETKRTKTLHPKARVTVRYRRQGESDVALEIRLHSTKLSKSS